MHVRSSEKLQFQRLMSRAGPSASEEDARARIASQAPLSSKLVYADYVIDNSGDIAELDRQVGQVVNKLKRQTGWPTWRLCWLLPPVGLLKGLFTVIYRIYYKKVGQAKWDRKRT